MLFTMKMLDGLKISINLDDVTVLQEAIDENRPVLMIRTRGGQCDIVPDPNRELHDEIIHAQAFGSVND